MIFRVAVLLVSTTLLQTVVGGPDVDCGNIIIVGNQRYSKLKKLYGNCTTASGIRVYGTNIKKLDFLSNIRMINTSLSATALSYRTVHTPPLYIRNNKYIKWTNKTFAKLSIIEVTSDYKAALVYIMNNGRLCVPQKRKEELLQLTERSAQIQLCQCYVRNLPSSISGYYSEFSNKAEYCEEINGDLRISDGLRGTPDPDFVKKIRNVRRIRGTLTIYKSCWKNLTFLARLERVTTEAKGVVPIRIESNPHLESALLPRLIFAQSRRTKLWLVIQDNPKYRLHSEGMAQLTRLLSKHRQKILIVKQHACLFTEDVLTADNIASLRGCIVIRGNITINEKSGFNHSGELWALRDVLELRGCLTISKTQFKDLKFLSNLGRLKCRSGRMPVVIENNFVLQSVDVSFKIWSNYTSPILLTNNGCLRSGVVAYLEQLWERPVAIYHDDESFTPCWSKPQFTNEILLLEVAVAVIMLIFFYFLGGFLIRGAIDRNQLESTSHSIIGS